MAQERAAYSYTESLIAAGKVIVEIQISDAKLAKFLLSNPIISNRDPRWLHIKLPGNIPTMWLMIDKAWER